MYDVCINYTYIIHTTNDNVHHHKHGNVISDFCMSLFLCSVGQNFCNPVPGVDAGLTSTVVQFVQESIVRDSVESLREI